MSKFITMIATIVAFLIAFPTPLIAQDKIPEMVCGEKDSVCLIKKYTKLFNSNTDTVYSVMMCESGGVWKEGDSGHSFGQFAYFEETWNRYAKLYRKTFGVDDQFDIKSLHDQVKLTSFAFSLGDINRNEWTTYVAIKKGGSYSFYSRFHKKYFTVQCPQQTIPA